MIDKSVRKAKAERFGNLIVVRMTGGEDCLWMNMYLDEETGQMTCDSDIGSYAYHWGRHNDKRENWTDFCCEWLSNEGWLLRKCCGERGAKMYFDAEKSSMELMKMFIEENDDDVDTYGQERCLEIANGYQDEKEWCVALNVAADDCGVDLPEEWWDCIVKDYTPWQKRFAEICREVIVPAIRAMDEKCCG